MIDKVVDALTGELVSKVSDKLQYSEIRLRLLKQFDLIPDTPPNNFEGVYVYTLIEYGVGKEKVILQLFKETEIKEEFRKAFNENRRFNYSILDNFIQSSDIGDKIKDQKIDYQQELNKFAQLFIEIAKRARTATEILQDHKLDKIENSLQDLQEIKKQLAQLAQSQQLLLPPGEIPRETELAKQLRKWFEALDYKFEPYEVLEKDYFQWIINIPKRRGYDRIFIHGVEAEAGINDINTVKKAVETYKTDEGWIIAPGRVSKLAREEVKKAENKQILCYTFDELIEENADFTGYFDWLEREVKSRGIDQYYVPLACTKEEINPHKQRIGISHYGEEDGWIEGYINQWLDDPVKEHLSVLGEFGTGKTWFAFHYAWLALQEYLKAKEKGTQRPRIPLVIPLRDYAKALRIEFLFLEFFFLKHKGLAKYTAFEQLNRMGKLLLIFDGFDEMAARVDRQAMINNFWELAKVVGTPGTKAILTCRTEHFPEALEGRSILNAELKASTSNLTGESPQFEVLELEKFDDQQIKQVLNFKTTPETVDSIINNEKLLDLARRPVMIDLIIEALPDIEAGKPVDISRVYLYAVRQKMERDIKADRTFTSMTDKLYFLCELSWEMLSNDKMSLNYKEFPDMIQRYFEKIVQQQKDLDHWQYDMMGQTMLIRNADGDYYPAHRSLLEFFVSYKLGRELGILAADFQEVVEVLPYDQGKIDLSQTFGKTLLAKAVLDLMFPMLSTTANQRLLAEVKATKGKTETIAAYCGSNAVQLLLKGSRFALEKQDLSETVIKNVDFSRASLYNVNLTNANLKESVFATELTSVLAVAFSPDGKVLATGEKDGRVRLWNVITGKELLTLRGHSSGVRSVAWSGDSQTLASGSDDKTVKLWNVQSGDCVRTLEGHSSSVISVAWSGDSQTLASGSSDNTVKLWNVQTGNCVRTLEGHSNWVNSVAWSGDSQTLASGSFDKTVKLWNVQTGNCVRTLEGHSSGVNSVAWSGDSQTLASGSDDNTVKLWNVQSGECVRTLEGHSSGVISVAWSGDSQTLASGSDDNTVKLWNVQSGECVRTLEGHSHWVNSVAWSADSQTLASGSRDNTVKLWNVQTGDCVRTPEGHSSSVISVAWSGDSQTLASGSDDNTVKLWNVQSGECVRTLEGHSSSVISVAWSGDSQTLASGSDDNTVKLWNVQTGNCVRTLEGHSNWVNSVAWSGDSQTLASGSLDNTVKLWNVQSGECVRTLEGHSNWVNSVAWSGDSLTLASGSDDNTVKLWNMQSGECIATFDHRLYAGLKIKGVKGLSDAEILTLKALGAVEGD
ncbi:MAG: pentapeptide repeat-containing protein [Dolichospermum sp.]